METNSLDGFNNLTDLMMSSYLLMTAAQVSKPKPAGIPCDLSAYPELDGLVHQKVPSYKQAVQRRFAV